MTPFRFGWIAFTLDFFGNNKWCVLLYLHLHNYIASFVFIWGGAGEGGGGGNEEMVTCDGGCG